MYEMFMEGNEDWPFSTYTSWSAPRQHGEMNKYGKNETWTFTLTKTLTYSKNEPSKYCTSMIRAIFKYLIGCLMQNILDLINMLSKVFWLKIRMFSRYRG